MLNLQKIPNKDIYTFTIEGELTEPDVHQFYDLLAEKAEQHEKIRVLGIVNEFPKLKDFQTLAETAKMKVKALQGIGKYAIISDKHWMEALLPVGNFLTPGLPIKHFASGELEQAVAWLETDEPADAAPQPADLRLTREAAGRVFSLTIDGQLTETGLSQLYQALDRMKTEGDLNLLVEVKDIDGFDHLGTLLDGIKGDLASLGYVKKYALVSDKGWVEKMAKVGDFVPGITMQSFRLAHRAQALAWLQA